MMGKPILQLLYRAKALFPGPGVQNEWHYAPELFDGLEEDGFVERIRSEKKHPSFVITENYAVLTMKGRLALGYLAALQDLQDKAMEAWLDEIGRDLQANMTAKEGPR